MATDGIRITTTFAPWGDGDPIPWAYAVFEGDDVTACVAGWAGTEAEAREYAQARYDGLYEDDDAGE